MAIHVAIGSFTDAVYKGVLYPAGLPAKDRLREYAKSFDHLEVNSTYYAPPKAETLADWEKQTPAGFMFTVKLTQAFSQNPGGSALSKPTVAAQLRGVEPLVHAGKFAGFLLVLPPSFGPPKRALRELDALADALSPHPIVVELRHRGWVDGPQRAETLRYFREKKLTLAAVDMPRIENSTLMPPVDEVTTPRLAYMRLHGRNPHYLELSDAAERHSYEYTTKDLEEIAQRARHLAAQAETVRVTANNHARDYAPKAALALKRLLGQIPSERPLEGRQTELF